MRRRQPPSDPMAAVPELLREFRPDDWVPALGLDAVEAWIGARRAWVAEHGYPSPDGDPIEWLQHQIEVSRQVARLSATVRD